MKTIYTSYFSNIKNVENPISIAGKCPDFYKGPEYKKLAPKYTWWKQWHDEKLSNEWYFEQYNKTVLQTLNPQKTLTELFSFYPGSDNVTIMCWEKPGLFCHRHLISDWLVKNIKDITVKEL